MPKTQTVLKLFLASPGDVTDERNVAERVINELNLSWSETLELRIELVRWETHTHPDKGEDSQEVINRQIGDDFDIFVGIMWGRFGTPTPRADSGTEEEFHRALQRYDSQSGIAALLFYFKDAGISPSRSVPSEIEKIQQFRADIGTKHGILYAHFESTEDFETKLRLDLSRVVQEYLHRPLEDRSKNERPTQDSNHMVAVDPLSNLSSVDDEEELGLIELQESAVEAMERVGEIVGRMTTEILSLTEKVNKRTGEARELAGSEQSKGLAGAKRIANSVAEDIEQYVKRMATEIPDFHEQHTRAMEDFSRLAQLSRSDLNEDAEDIENVFIQLSSYEEAMVEGSSQLVAFRGSIESLPRMTSQFNRARRRAIAITDDLLAQIRMASSQSDKVRMLLVSMLSD